MLTDNTRGALLMMASMAGFTLNDTFMKALSGEMPLFQLIFLRGILTTLAIGAMAWYVGALHLRIPRRDRALITLRMFAEIGSAYFFLTALYNMPLANVSAIMQSLPLVVTLAAALFFGEPLGWRRMTAIGGALRGPADRATGRRGFHDLLGLRVDSRGLRDAARSGDTARIRGDPFHDGDVHHLAWADDFVRAR